MIKNWTTIFKTIKKTKNGFINYLTYLNNNNHKNHRKENHKIIEFGKNIRELYIENLKILDEQNYKKIMKNDGGRYSKSFGVSVSLSLPFDLENYKKEELEKFIEEFTRQYYKDLLKINKLKFSEKSYKKWETLIFYNIHKKDKGSKTQFNFTFPHYIFSSKNLIIQEETFLKNKITKIELTTKKINMTQKKYSFLFKNLGNKFINKHFNLDNEKYISETIGTQKKRQSTNYYKKTKQEKELKLLNEKVEKMEKTIKKMGQNSKEMEKMNIMLDNEIKDKKREIDNINTLKLEYKNKLREFDFLNEDKTLNKYLERINKYINENNTEKIEETKVVIEKRIEKVKKYNNEYIKGIGR